MIRPEAARTLARWREVWVGAAIGLAGFWIAGLGGWFYLGLGVLIGAAGLGAALVGLRRMRVPHGGGGPGTVEVVEGQITYLAAEGGGFVALSEVTAIEIAAGPGGRVWRFAQAGGPTLSVPVAAHGAEVLYDVVSALPGARPAHILATLEGPEPHRPVAVWRRARHPALT